MRTTSTVMRRGDCRTSSLDFIGNAVKRFGNRRCPQYLLGHTSNQIPPSFSDSFHNFPMTSLAPTDSHNLAFGLQLRKVLLHAPHGKPDLLRQTFAGDVRELRDKIKNLYHTFYHTFSHTFLHGHQSITQRHKHELDEFTGTPCRFIMRSPF